MGSNLIYDVDVSRLYGEFVDRVNPIVEDFGGKYLARGGPHEILEGNWELTRVVLFEFHDRDAARKLLTSDEYAHLKERRQNCSTGNVVIVQGL